MVSTPLLFNSLKWASQLKCHLTFDFLLPGYNLINSLLSVCYLQLNKISFLFLMTSHHQQKSLKLVIVLTSYFRLHPLLSAIFFSLLPIFHYFPALFPHVVKSVSKFLFYMLILDVVHNLFLFCTVY